MSDIPTHLKYTKTHEWLDEREEEVVIGITAHAQHLLGDLVYIELPAVGGVISAGDEIGVVESVKAAADVYSPIGGTVIAINQKVSEDPSLVNHKPYGDGWLVKIKPNSGESLATLLDAHQYQQLIAEEN